MRGAKRTLGPRDVPIARRKPVRPRTGFPAHAHRVPLKHAKNGAESEQGKCFFLSKEKIMEKRKKSQS